MTTRVRAAFLAASFLTCLPAAAEMLALRRQVDVSGETVRLGDLVTGAGDKSGIPLFRAPDLGKAGTIRAESVAQAVRELGLEAPDRRGLDAVTVTRPARELALVEVRTLAAQALIRLDASLSDATIVFDRDPAGLMIARDAPVQVEVVEFDIEKGRFSARIIVAEANVATVTGVIESRTGVPVLIRPVQRGDVVGAGDIAWEQRPRRSLPQGVVTEPGRLASVVARRALRAGQMVLAADVAPRDLVERNGKVTVTLQQGGLNLTLTGKALAAGAAGATVPVQNVTTKRTFDAVVTGPGAVSARLN